MSHNFFSTDFYKKLLICVLGYGSLLAPAVEASHPENIEEHTAKVFVWQENLSDKVVYHYSVVNEADRVTITSIKVGYDYFHGVPLLRSHPTSIRAPQGWTSSIVRTEETLDFEVEWRRSDRAYSIQPGQERRGFAVEVPVADNLYRATFFTVFFGDSTIASTHLTTISAPPPGDTSPPTLSVTLSPNTLWPPNRKMVDIAAEITVQDDQDPNPVVKLISITCNECVDTNDDVKDATFGTDDRAFAVRAERTGQRKEGRVYTVIYSATDAAGNSAIKEITVTVPHDQRK